MTGTRQLPHLSVRRTYAAPPDTVFRAFTEAPLLERWFRPGPEVSVTVEQLELRVGGRYRFLFHLPDNRIAVVAGEYRTVTRPDRLAFTWSWQPPDPHAGTDTLVTIDFKPKNGGTELVLTHAGFPTEDAMRQHEQGWSASLASLGEVVDPAE